MRLLSTLLLGLLGPGVAQATTYEVKIGPSSTDAYSPQAMSTLHVGDAVKFTWVSGTHPTVSDSSPEAWPAFTLSATNSSQTITFTKAGTYPYHCSAHAYQTAAGTWAGMVGSITVQAALATAPTQTALSFGLYPNPAHGQTTVQMSAPTGPDYQLRLSNVLGQEMRRLLVRPETLPPDGGLALDLSNLPPGLYFCSLLLGDKTLATKRLTVM